MHKIVAKIQRILSNSFCNFRPKNYTNFDDLSKEWRQNWRPFAQNYHQRALYELAT